MRKTLLESLTHGPLTEPAPAPMKLHSLSLPKPSTAPLAPGLVVRCPFARSMPVPAMVASWKSMRSIMRFTISSALACALLLRHAMPMC